MVTLFSLAQEIAERVINSGAYHCRDMADEIDSVLRNHIVEDDDGAQCIEIEKDGDFCGKCRYFHTFDCNRGKLHLRTADPCGKYKEGE